MHQFWHVVKTSFRFLGSLPTKGSVYMGWSWGCDSKCILGREWLLPSELMICLQTCFLALHLKRNLCLAKVVVDGLIHDTPSPLIATVCFLSLNKTSMKISTRWQSFQQIWKMPSGAGLYFILLQDMHSLNSLFFFIMNSITFIVLVNSHQRWKLTRNRVCFHLWCELTLALWCHSIVWSLFSWNKM